MALKVEPQAKRISTVELLRNFGLHSDEAAAEPVVITKHGRDRFVLITIDQYRERTGVTHDR